eukprot:TRINITY_DN10825_c0_g1_i1.p1 TRINITY_DN10825_c0_g1~~TRINITY_DN10825_c0_g1_i1.p1  ORF type:complete len:145 (+),score=26.60 TRINITY_DN10825_c0_g1_i1:82-516(+)
MVVLPQFQTGLRQIDIDAKTGGWTKTPLTTVEECMRQYRQHAYELRKSLDAIASIEDEKTPADLALSMRREVLQEIYDDVMAKYQMLKGVATQRRQVEIKEARKPLTQLNADDVGMAMEPMKYHDRSPACHAARGDANIGLCAM